MSFDQFDLIAANLDCHFNFLLQLTLNGDSKRSFFLLAHFWEFLGWILAFNRDALQLAATLPQNLTLAVIVVLCAGLSQAIGQSVILFINRVRPLRFLFSLLINAILFVVGFLFLVLSTWLITLAPWLVQVPFRVLATLLGLSYAPMLFSFLGALPYLGVPILSILSIWHLLVMVVSFTTITEQGFGQAFEYVAFGWIVLQLLQQTVGQPIAKLGDWLINTVAGVDLATTQQELAALLSSDTRQAGPPPFKEEMRERITKVRQSFTRGGDIGERLANMAQGAKIGTSRDKTLLGLLGIVLMALLTVIVLAPARIWFFGWGNSLPSLFQVLFDLVWIALVAVVVAGLLAPLETLGWWAGWYKDESYPTPNEDLTETIKQPNSVSRYLVYLDGIGKSTFEYLPDIEEFLDTLALTLPDDIALLRGIMPYSVLNKPLDEDRPLAFLWKLADQSRLTNPASLLGLLVNIRNILAVAVCADQRYGPLYRQGIAQVVYNGLCDNEYRPGSGIPITLLGYSGGGQMSVACVPFLKQALNAPIEVISLGGVMSANGSFLELERLYHLVGDKDIVERFGAVMFFGRWQLFPLSDWNRAKRRGKISIISLGPVGHQVPGGMLDPKFILPDGRSALEQTLDYILAILQGNLLPTEPTKKDFQVQEKK